MTKYRPDVDGLRAIAVISVLLYHLGVERFSGGFVGVDVFFVISGFLITGIIANAERTGSLSFASFYASRARRLLPALTVTCIAVLAAAAAFFSLPDAKRLVGSAITAMLGASNFQFWREANYFDVAAHLKPLLHTWSLGVETQFYLLWPAELVFCIRRGNRYVIALLAITIIGSLAISQYLLATDPSGAFYLPPSRMFEFAIGAAIALIPDRQKISPAIGNALVIFGVGFIAVAVFGYDTKTPFPALAALLPCVGTAFCILGGTKSPLARVMVGNRLASGIGLISYSVYLVHWPLIVFHEYVSGQKAAGLVAIGIGVASFGLGFLMYRYVEQPCRRFRWSNPGTAAAAIVSSVLVSVIALSAQDGWRWRFDQAALNFPSTEQWRKLEHDQYCTHPDASMPSYIFSCQNFRGKNQTIILWGDSHAQHLAPGFSEAFKDYNVIVAEHDGCVYQSGFAGYVQNMGGDLTKSCVFDNKRTFAFLESLPPTNIILTSTQHGGPASLPAIKFVVDGLRAKGHNVIVVGDFTRPNVDLASCLQRPSWLNSSCHGDKSNMLESMKYNDEMASLIPGFVNPNQVQCPNHTCQVWLDGAPMFRDTHHLTVAGSIAMVAKLKPLLHLQQANTASR